MAVAAGVAVNRKRIQRLMRVLGIEAIYPKPNLSRPAPGHEVYPYLLRGVSIERPNQVWSTDITYIRCRPASCIWSPSWIGSAVSCSVGNSPTHGDAWLCRGAGERLSGSEPEDLELRSRCRSSPPAVSGAAERAADLHQHGWTRPRPGQCFHRAAVALVKYELIYPGDFASWGELRRRWIVLSFLQSPAPAPGAGTARRPSLFPRQSIRKRSCYEWGLCPNPRDLALFSTRMDDFSLAVSSCRLQWRA